MLVAEAKTLNGFLGLNTRDDPAVWPWWVVAQNVMAASGAPDAQALMRPGTAKLFSTALVDKVCHGLFSWKSEADGLIKLMFAGDTLLYWTGSWTVALTVNGTWTWAATDQFSFAATQDMVYIVNGSTGGYGTNWRFDGTDIHPMGGKAPASGPTVAAGAAGALTGSYAYVTTDYDTTLARETDPSAATSVSLTAQIANISAVPANPDASFNAHRLYRTVASGERYFYVKQFTGATTTDQLADSLLGYEVGEAGVNKDTIGWVARCIAVTSDGRTVIANDVTNGRPRRIACSYDQAHPESFPLSGQMDAGEENGYGIVVLVPHGDEITVICEDSIWMINSTCTSCTRRVPDVGGVGPWSACSSPYGVFLVGHGGVYLFNGTTCRRLTDAISGTWAAVLKSRLAWTSIVYDGERDHVLVSVTTTVGGTKNDTVLALDCRTLGSPDPRWSVWTISADKLEAIKGWDGTTKYVAFSFQNLGFLGKLDKATYVDFTAASTAAIAISMQTGPEDFGASANNKLVMRAFLETLPKASGTVTLGLRTDAAVADEASGVCLMTARMHRVALGVRGRVAQVSLAASNSGAGFGFASLVLEADILGRRID